MKKKILAAFLAAAMVFSLAACGSSSSESGSSDSEAETSAEAEAETEETDGYLKDTISIAISADGGTLDPFASFVNWGMADMTGLIYQGLVNIDYDYNIYYNMAKEIEQVDDLNWSLTIWDCIYDTDGNQITIDDVIWSYDQVIATGNAGAIPKFDHWEKTDDYSATMVLKEAFGDGDYEKHFGNAKILSQATYEAHNNDMTTEPVGTGPYKLADYTVNSEVVLEADEDWWGLGVIDEDNPMVAQNFKTMKYEVIQDASSRAIALEMGTVDIVDSMDAADIENLSGNEGISIIDLPQRPPVAFVINANEQSVCSSQALRQAICYGLDNDAIADSMGVPTEPCYGLQPRMVDAPESWVTGEGRDYYAYDADKAAELIDEAGYNGETLTLMYISSTTNDAAAIMIQSQLRSIGINVELFEVDMTSGMQYKYDPTKWDIRLETLGGGAYLSQTAKTWWSDDIKDLVPDTNWNTSLVEDAELDALYVALKDDASEENIAAWDEYFNDACYAYAICSYSGQTACISDLESNFLSTNSSLEPNTFTLAK